MINEDTAESKRLKEYRERESNWKHWGPYLSERSWGTVREDYSASSTPWHYITHDDARSRAYRWGEDGIAGVCDRNQFLCLALSFWNGKDPILKERFFGLANHEGESRRGRQGAVFLFGLLSYPQLHEDALQVSPG